MNDIPRKPRTRLRWAIALAWLVMCAVINYFADRGLLTPVYGFISAHPGTDKIGHFVIIGVAAGLLNFALGQRAVRWLGCGWLLGSVFVAVCCTLEEISQIWLPTRTFDLLDLAGDYAGIFFFGWLAKVVARWRGQL
ncbi:MAG: VanZ family protein [Chthoniobacter sp.]|nr:VanZ family protein [Chthoniobacter sp.]